jgi:hypothetical protein
VKASVAITSCATLLVGVVWLLARPSPALGASESAAVPETGPTWAFSKPIMREPPTVREQAWVRNPIDAFVLNRLEQSRIAPAPEAPKQALLRRAYLDLIGLPPTPEEVDAFTADTSSNAFEKVVDHLLASPQYGQRWARHWLDLARYADSEGFKADETRPNAWRYRDYVIDSLNQDKPYDRFIREQIAGDELWPDDPAAHVATYFLRSYPDESNARDLLQRRQQILNDDTDTVGSVFLGLTVGCARCHDHKFDRISQRDYYRLQAFFAGLRADDDIPIASPDEIREHDAKLAAWEEKTESIRQEMARIEEPKRKAILKDYFDKYPTEIQASLLKLAADRTPLDWVFHYKAAQYLEPDSYQYLAPDSAVVGGLKPDAKARLKELKQKLDAYASLKPTDFQLGTGVRDAVTEAPPTYILRRGVYDAPEKEVKPGFPTALDSSEPKIVPLSKIASSGRRSALADWLASPQNSLTARVIVNRIWNYHFGRGIVGTPGDFGKQGDRPSHPELLDWLAIHFVHDGWSLKKLHRLIMTSSTYRQSTAPAALAMKADPDDLLLWRFPRKRLEAEVIRDSALSVAGLLNPKMGGPGIFPEIPPGMQVRGGWPVTKDQAERNRRSVYIFVRRNTRYPLLEAFDMPEAQETCSRRFVTTTPSQALMLLNDKLALQWAGHFAGRVARDAGPDRRAMIDAACRLAFCRPASPEEMHLMNQFLDRQQSIIADRVGNGEKLAMPDPPAINLAPADAAALVDLCHVLLNSNEFVYSD